MATISWETTEEERGLIDQIVARTMILAGGAIDSLSLEMDLSATHANGCPIDFGKLLAFDDFNFIHDVSGIMNKIDRTSGKLTDCFLPRSARNQ